MAKSNTNLNITVQAWSDILLENWLDNMHKLRIGYTFDLENSIQYGIEQGSDKLPSAIEFSFMFYGKFVDMGVGNGVKLEDVKSGFHNRRPKKWYSKTFYGQTLKLSMILAQKYARIAAVNLVENLSNKQ
jgi:hypothetical protein